MGIIRTLFLYFVKWLVSNYAITVDTFYYNSFGLFFMFLLHIIWSCKCNFKWVNLRIAKLPSVSFPVGLNWLRNLMVSIVYFH